MSGIFGCIAVATAQTLDIVFCTQYGSYCNLVRIQAFGSQGIEKVITDCIEQGITIDWIRQQIKIAFLNVTADQAKTAVIAYEPIWAIGTGKVATTEQAQEVCAAIRACIGEIYDEATAAAIRIQYGGSVSAASAPELFAQADIDGGLVGGASLEPDFGAIVNYNK